MSFCLYGYETGDFDNISGNFLASSANATSEEGMLQHGVSYPTLCFVKTHHNNLSC